VEIENTETGERRIFSTPAVFFFVGAIPRTDWLPAEIETDAKGFIRTGRPIVNHSYWRPATPECSPPAMSGSAPSSKRCTAGVGEGSMAIAFIHQYLAYSHF
jgi:thioredoxin reductase (NADPH)